MSEVNSSLQSLGIRDREGQCCAPSRRIKWLKNKGAILIVLWSHLVGSVFYFLRAGYKDNTTEYVSNTGIILIGSTLLYPIGGWLADTRLGRYIVIKYSMLIMWIVSVLLTINEVVSCVSVVYTAVKWPVFVTLSIILAIALGGFLSNVVQLGTDQLINASATEITSFITWYTLTYFTSGVAFHYISDCIQIEYQILYIKPLVMTVCLTIAICSNFLCEHWLVKEHVAGRSLSLISNVIKYTIRNHKFKYNYLNENESLSSFDIAKHRYGGPFTAHQVENVRTFLWIIAVIALCAAVCGVPVPLGYAQGKMMKQVIITPGCYEKLTIRYSGLVLVTTLVILLEFLVLPAFSNFIPRVSITSTFMLGALATLLWIISLLVIETVAYKQGLHPGSCIFADALNEAPNFNMDFKWFLIPECLNSLSTLLLMLSGLKFVWSQSPSTMKGMTLGIGYTLLGLSSLLHTAISSPFVFHKPVTVLWENAKLTCGIWYFMVEGLLSVIAIIIILFVFRRYNKRNHRRDYDSLTVSDI